MIIEYQTGEQAILPAPLGVKVGDQIEAGTNAGVKSGNVLPLRSIPAGTQVFNIEIIPGDGGKMVRSSGSAARVVSHEEGRVVIKLPSKVLKRINPDCRATIGMTAGFVLYPLMKLLAGRHREVPPGLWILGALSLCFFIFYPY